MRINLYTYELVLRNSSKWKEFSGAEEHILSPPDCHVARIGPEKSETAQCAYLVTPLFVNSFVPSHSLFPSRSLLRSRLSFQVNARTCAPSPPRSIFLVFFFCNNCYQLLPLTIARFQDQFS